LGGKILAGTAILGAVGGGMSMFDASMSDNLDNPEDEKKTAGMRKHGDEIEAKQKSIDESSEALEYVRGTHDQALIAALEAEEKAKKAEKDLLEKDVKRLDKLEADYERKRKTIETLESYQKRLTKMGRTKEADALGKQIEELKKSAGKDKGDLAAAGLSTQTENAKWQKINDWVARISAGFSGIFSLMQVGKNVVSVIGKVGSFGARMLGNVIPAVAKVGGVLGTVGNVIKSIGAFEWVGRIVNAVAKVGQVLGRLFGIFDGISAFMQTEGPLGRKLSAGVAAGATSTAIRFGVDAIGAGAEATGIGAVAGAGLQIAGNVGAPFAAQAAGKGGSWLYDKIFSTDAQIPTVMPSSATASSPSGVPANGNMTMGPVGPDGKSQVTLTFSNAQQFVQSANTRIISTQTGLSGGR
jgi:hypothetical protein